MKILKSVNDIIIVENTRLTNEILIITQKFKNFNKKNLVSVLKCVEYQNQSTKIVLI